MKHLICFVSLSSILSGCLTATPQIIDNGRQSRVFTPCASGDLCFRDTYDVVWDNWRSCNSPDYPVSYRTKQSEYESNKVEYIRSVVAEQVQLGGAK